MRTNNNQLLRASPVFATGLSLPPRCCEPWAPIYLRLVFASGGNHIRTLEELGASPKILWNQPLLGL
jgi:hypothetical protein